MFKWNKMSLRKKYLLTLCSSFILFAIMSVMLIFQVNNNKRWSEELNSLSEHIKDIDKVSKDFSALYISIIHYTGDPLPQYEEDYNKTEDMLNKELKNANSYLSVDDQELVLKEQKRIEQLFTVRLKKSVAVKDNIAKRRQLNSVYDSYGKIIDKLTLVQENKSQERTVILSKMKESQQQTIYLLCGSFLLAMTISLLLLLRTNHQIRNQLERVASTTRAISKGHLEVQDLPIVTNDEIGQVSKGMNHMKHQLTEMIQMIKQSADTISQDSAVLQQYSYNTVEGTNDVSKLLEKCLKNAKEQQALSDKIVQFMDHFSQNLQFMIQEIHELSSKGNDAEKLIYESNQSMHEAVDQMDILKTLLLESEEERKLLQERTDEIVRVSLLVKQISKQTHLLAINAEIEAARSGEAGKGFAVVAEEVRELADEVSNAANTIHTLSDQITTQGKSMENAFNAGLDTSVNSGEAVKKIATEMEAITAYIQDTKQQFTDMENQITELEEEKTKTIEFIEHLNHTITSSTAHIEHTNEILLENNSTVKKLSHLVDDVHEQTKGMYTTTEKFSLS
ncbi:methyl-accepting chemotaxis protein [Rummeliibacillus pycnus]|uniref:methyl-accepting chemotaxis protein n=1 Tax=Rummeliibacillus pycnus TaxID=101070 RepID=UPI003D27C820